MTLKTKIDICHIMHLGDIVTELQYSEISNEDRILFIKKIDEGMDSWGATETLYNYFLKLHKQYLKEFNKNDC